MDDKFYISYKSRVYVKLAEAQRGVIPPTWWDSVIKYYYTMGYSEEQTVHIILETMKK